MGECLVIGKKLNTKRIRVPLFMGHFLKIMGVHVQMCVFSQVCLPQVFFRILVIERIIIYCLNQARYSGSIRNLVQSPNIAERSTVPKRPFVGWVTNLAGQIQQFQFWLVKTKLETRTAVPCMFGIGTRIFGFILFYFLKKETRTRG